MALGFLTETAMMKRQGGLRYIQRAGVMPSCES